MTQLHLAAALMPGDRNAAEWPFPRGWNATRVGWGAVITAIVTGALGALRVGMKAGLGK